MPSAAALLAVALLGGLLLLLLFPWQRPPASPFAAVLSCASPRPSCSPLALLVLMPRKPTGNPYEQRGRWYARVRLRPGTPENVPMPACSTTVDARERAALLAELGARLCAAGHVDLAPGFLERAGARVGKALDDVVRAVDAVCSGKAAPKRRGAAAKPVTFHDLGTAWTSGEIAKDHPDHVRAKGSAGNDVYRLERYVYPLVRDVRIVEFTIDHAEAVMRALPPKRAPATRRHVAQVIHRILSLAVFPLRLLAANPLPRGFLPSVGSSKALSYLYPDEDAVLLGCPAVPLCWRVFYGFLDREGMRASEAVALTWEDLDLERGAVTLDRNKTDDPRAWALSPGVVAALSAWREHLRNVAPVEGDAPVFVDELGRPITDSHLAEQFREHLEIARIRRAALFERSGARRPIRLHDLRATFITIALANGRSEAWVQDRTGHRSSIMLNRYRRAARSVAELGLGELRSLVDAIPELGGISERKSEREDDPSGHSGTNTAKHSTSAPWRNGRRRGFKKLNPGGEGSRPVETPGERGKVGDGARRGAEPFATSRGSIATSSGAPGGARVELARRFLEQAQEAIAAGDLDAARIAQEAAGKLLAVPGTSSGSRDAGDVSSEAAGDVSPRSSGDGARVVDLAGERRKRGGR